MPQEGHTNLLSQRFAQPPKLAVIPDCLTAERNHLSHRKLILQVTSELHHVISLLLGCLQKNGLTKKKSNSCFPQCSLSNSLLLHVPSMSLLTPSKQGTPVCSKVNFTHHINKQIKQKSP